nr:glycoside hydrolase family 32 protein [Colwellia sp. MB02u-9]
MSNQNVINNLPYDESGGVSYSDQYRPQFHFTPKENWMNDPNGMVYYQGEYHLFYQYHPESTVWGPMHWGHAISKDLVHWEQFPIALYPDELGTIFSGSAVVDWNNTSGLGTTENPPLIAIYTYHSHELENIGRNDFQTQAIAYSLDKGRTWEKYSQNPVLPNPGIRDFRDPKVSWHEESQKWIMVLAQADHIGFYSSTNLIDWKLESTFGKEWGVHAGVWECPDLIKMPIEGTSEFKYALIVSINPGGPNGGSATQYFVGDFDGKTFTLTDDFKEDVKQVIGKDGIVESGVWLDYGTDNYAGVTFSDVPKNDGRVLFMAWMSNWQYANQVPTEAWRSAMTIPRSLKLDNSLSGLRITSQPVEELNKLVKNKQHHGNLTSEKKYELITASDSSKLYRLELDVVPLDANLIDLVFANQLGEKSILTIKVNEGVINFDRTHSGKVDFEQGFPSIQKALTTKNLLKYTLDIYVDHSSFEIFINNGKTVITSIVFPSIPYSNVSIEGNTIFNIDNLTISELKSIW